MPRASGPLERARHRASVRGTTRRRWRGRSTSSPKRRRAADGSTRSGCGTRRGGSTSRSTSASPGSHLPSLSRGPRRPTRSTARSTRWWRWRGCGTRVSCPGTGPDRPPHDRGSADGGVARARAVLLGILAAMASPSSLSPTDPVALQDRINDVLRSFLSARRQELAWLDPRATEPIDEVIGLFEAGGKRIRPAFCYWGFRAAGGPHGEAILRAAASLELLHTMALIHDDVMDGSATRRGRPTVHARQAEAAASRGQAEPERIGTAVAILGGDLASVLADH